MKSSDDEDRFGKRSIGHLNGPWAFSLKIMLATYPLLAASVLAWGSWVTRELVVLGEFRARGDQVTQADALRMRREIDAQFAALPPKDWRDRYVAMETQLAANRDLLVRLQAGIDALQQDVREIKQRQMKP